MPLRYIALALARELVRELVCDDLLRLNSITLSIPLRYPGRRPGRRPAFRPVADRFELSPHIEIARTWSQTGSGHIPLRYPARELVASWIA